MFICADVTDIADGADARIRIVEKDDDGNDDDVAVLDAAVEDGKIRYKWKVIYTEDNDDTDSQKELAEKGYTLPEYAFTAECGGTESGESGQLDVLGWIKTQFKDKETGLPIANRKFRVYSFDRRIKIDGSTDGNGYADLKNINISKYYIFWRKDKNEWDTVYVKGNGNSRYVASLADFEIMTAALYGETDEDNYTLEEMQAIGDVIMNRSKLQGTSLSEEIVLEGQVNGYYDNDSQGVTSRGKTSDSNTRLKTARNAAITTLLGISRGKSNGAYWWDGADIKSNKHNTEWGIHYTDPKHDIYGTGDTTVGPFQEHWQPSGKNRGAPWNHKLDSTVAFGGTIFWKKNPNYQDVTNKKAYP